MTITLTVPDAKAAEVLEVVTDVLGYDGEGTRKAFLDTSIKNYVKNAYINGKIEQQRQAANQEEEILRRANRDEEDSVREAAKTVNIDVG